MKLVTSRLCLAVLCWLIVAAESVNGLTEPPPPSPNKTFPAIIVFGDSIVDTGNNNRLRTAVKCNFPPYGRDFHGGIPTGRFSNGKVPSDIFAEELGIKEVVPAYSDPNLKPQDLLTGVTFASGGTGYDPLTPKLVSVTSLSDQLKQFREYIGKLKGIVGEKETNFILANSVYIVVAGSNDISNTYFMLRARKFEFDIPSYTHLLSTSAATFLQELYKLGARRIGVFSAPPIGCVPSQKTVAGGITRQCAQSYNQAATLFNSKLSSTIDSLGKTLNNSRFVYIDVYYPLLDLIQNPTKFGFRVADRGCCGLGKVEVATLCNQFTPVICANVSEYVFWDSYHPTERAYRALISPLFNTYFSRFI